MGKTKEVEALAPEKPQVSHVINGQEANVKMLEKAVQLNEAVLLIGETGTGKTTIIKNVAERMSKTWVRFNLTGDTTVDEFVGKYVLENQQTVWKDGVLLQAMKKGHWLIVDEINAALPEILFVLHPLLDDDRSVLVANHEGETVHPHADFRFFATMNPVDEYAGTKELNKAFKSRFGVTLIIDRPPQDVEVEILTRRTGISEGDARLMVMVGTKLRELKDKETIFLTCSTRDLIQWGNLTNVMNISDAFRASILNKSDNADERKKIIEELKSIFKVAQDMKKAGNKDLDPEFFQKEAQKMVNQKAEMEAQLRAQDSTLRQQIAAEERQKILDQLASGGGLSPKAQAQEQGQTSPSPASDPSKSTTEDKPTSTGSGSSQTPSMGMQEDQSSSTSTQTTQNSNTVIQEGGPGRASVIREEVYQGDEQSVAMAIKQPLPVKVGSKSAIEAKFEEAIKAMDKSTKEIGDVLNGSTADSLNKLDDLLKELEGVTVVASEKPAKADSFNGVYVK